MASSPSATMQRSVAGEAGTAPSAKRPGFSQPLATCENWSVKHAICVRLRGLACVDPRDTDALPPFGVRLDLVPATRKPKVIPVIRADPMPRCDMAAVRDPNPSLLIPVRCAARRSSPQYDSAYKPPVVIGRMRARPADGIGRYKRFRVLDRREPSLICGRRR